MCVLIEGGYHIYQKIPDLTGMLGPSPNSSAVLDSEQPQRRCAEGTGLQDLELLAPPFPIHGEPMSGRAVQHIQSQPRLNIIAK